MEQLKDDLLTKETQAFEYQVLIEHLIKGIDSGHLDATMLDRAREVAGCAG